MNLTSDLFTLIRFPTSSRLSSPILVPSLMSTSNGSSDTSATVVGVDANSENASQESKEPVFAVPTIPIRKSAAMAPPPPPLFPKEQREASTVKEDSKGRFSDPCSCRVEKLCLHYRVCLTHRDLSPDRIVLIPRSCAFIRIQCRTGRTSITSIQRTSAFCSRCTTIEVPKASMEWIPKPAVLF